MKTFKEQIKKDLSVFLNEIEFAEEHEIQGELVPCVIDEDIFQERNTSKKEESQFGVFTKQVSVFVREVSLLSRPLPEQRITVDGEDYKVKDVISANGLLELMLEQEDH